MLAGCHGALAAEALQLEALEFGLHADGQTDDGPVIRKMLDRVRSGARPAVIRFPANRKISVATGDNRYAFRLDQIHGLTIDGGGSTFLVHKDLRFLSATRCQDLQLTGFHVDVTPSPVAEGTVVESRENGRRLVVRLADPAQAEALGGPTKQDGEQDFFGMLWIGPQTYDQSAHYYVRSVARGASDGLVEVEGGDHLPDPVAAAIIPGKTPISLPVPGIAHRRGPGPMVLIDRCTNVKVESVEIWSAPWFAFEVLRNDGPLTFRNVMIRPKPDSGRITSSWRDGFHVKGNSGEVLFEGCILEGMNDDAFNISSHAWEIVDVPAPNRARIQQVFPVISMPFREGGEALILTPDCTRRLGPAKFQKLTGLPGEEFYAQVTGDETFPRTPAVDVVFDHPVEGLERGCILWDQSTSNPRTTIRNCRIRMSSRLQSGVTVENCDVTALLWFYSHEVEGPVPSNVILRNNTLRVGRGNPGYAVIFDGWRAGGKAPEELPAPGEYPMQNLRIEGNTFHGAIRINGAAGVQLINNRFPDAMEQIQITGCADVTRQ